MRKLVETTVNLGVVPSLDMIEQRRVRLVNTFSLIMLVLAIMYALSNFLTGSYRHTLLVLSCIPLWIAPTFLLNFIGKTRKARHFFIFSSYLLMNIIAFSAIVNFPTENRANEVFIIGFSAIVVILLDNPLKVIMYVAYVCSAMLMMAARQHFADLPFDEGFILAEINILSAGMCIYFFTSIFQKDLSESNKMLEKSSIDAETNQQKIITQHHELMMNRLFMRSLIDNLPVYLSMIDTDGRLLVVNNMYADSFNMKVSDLEGQIYHEVVPSSYIDDKVELVDRCLKGETIEIDEELEIHHKKVDVFGKYMPLYDHDHRIIGAFAYAFDVTKLKAIEKELKVHNKTKDKLLSIVSHDFRTPLNSLKEVLKLADHMNPEEMEMIIHKISSQVNTVSSTLDNLLNWVKTQFEGFSAKPSRINVADLIEESISLYRLPINNKSIEVVNHLDTESYVTADPDHLLLVFRNLISNSIKFTPQGGHITFDFENTNGHSLIRMKDSGIGMDDLRLAEVLNGQKIVRSRPGTNGEKGTGLGLAFCKDLLALNHVAMDITSEINQGTEIEMTFEK